MAGGLVYATYLAHSLIFIVFKLAFVGADKQVGWAGLAAYLGIVLAASWVLYTRLEKPAQAWLNANAPDWAGNRHSLAPARVSDPKFAEWRVSSAAPARTPTRPPIRYTFVGGRVGVRAGAALPKRKFRTRH